MTATPPVTLCIMIWKDLNSTSKQMFMANSRNRNIFPPIKKKSTVSDEGQQHCVGFELQWSGSRHEQREKFNSMNASPAKHCFSEEANACGTCQVLYFVLSSVVIVFVTRSSFSSLPNECSKENKDSKQQRGLLQHCEQSFSFLLTLNIS